VTLRLGSGEPLVAGRRLAAGGQGEVHAVESPPGHVFKKYFPRELAKDPTLQPRLRSMVSNPPEGWREHSGHINMAWPVDVVYEDAQFAGFIMPTIDMASTVGIHRITNPSDRNREDPTRPGAWMAGFTWRYLVRAAVNLVQVTHAMHVAGTVIGDFNDANVRVGRDARVALLDCDSMQITDATSGEMYLCRVGRPEYTAPELLHEDWNITPREPSSDIFALSIHLYALLLEGEHPFRGVWDWEGEKPSVTELAARGIWAYLEDGPLLPRPAAIGIDLLPPDIKQLFRTAFEHGSYSPEHRPGADEWHRALQDLEDDLRTCAVDQSHVYPGFHRGDCPWCEHARRVAALASAAPRPGKTEAASSAGPSQSASSQPTHLPSQPVLAPAPSRPAAVPGLVPRPAAVRGSLSSPLGRAMAPVVPADRVRDPRLASPMRTLTPAGERMHSEPLQPFRPGTDAVAAEEPVLSAPPRSWREHWSGHTELLTLHSADDHAAVYFDAEVDPRQAGWLPRFVSGGWEYVKATYGNGFGSDPRLYSVHHAGRYPGGRVGTYRDPGFDARNVIDLGAGSWRETDEFSRDEPFREIAHLVEFASNRALGSPAAHLWGGSAWADIFTYDVYMALGLGADAGRCYQAFATRHVSGFPRSGTWWFRDWFYPLWRDCGGGAVLARFFALLATYFPKSEDNRYSRNLTWGEYFHFTSGAARGDLRDQAAGAFGWSREWEAELARAREEFPAITY
jgi:serine/threonine protein kinase